MDVAAQQIQREVQGVSRHGDDEEHHHVAGMAPKVLNT